MVDGGLNYARWGWGVDGSVIDFSMYMEDNPISHQTILLQMEYIIQEYVILKDIPDDWLEAILLYYIPSPSQIGTMRDEYLYIILNGKTIQNVWRRVNAILNIEEEDLNLFNKQYINLIELHEEIQRSCLKKENH